VYYLAQGRGVGRGGGRVFLIGSLLYSFSFTIILSRSSLKEHILFRCVGPFVIYTVVLIYRIDPFPSLYLIIFIFYIILILSPLPR
jgi:hypothetical protein